MGWTGDLSKFGKLSDTLSRLAQVPSRTAARVSKDIAELIDVEFQTGTDPYGSAWEPLSDATLKKGRHEPPLTDTGAMRHSVTVAPMRSAVVFITIDHPSEMHQRRTRDMPARPILPSKRFPDSWEAAIKKAFDEEVREAKK